MEQAKAVTGGMPKSCLRVLEVLGSCDYASQRKVSEKTRLSLRSVKAALNRLEALGYVDEKPVLYDMRRRLYSRTCKGSNSIGILGGLGPETTARFYLALVRHARRATGCNPRITIDNTALPVRIEKEIIVHSKNEEKLLPYLEESISRLNRAGVGTIVLPCNTAHLFIDNLRKASKARIMSMIELTIDEVKKRRVKSVGILATTKTVKSGLYQKHLEEAGIMCIIPEEKKQKALSNRILSILKKGNDKRTEEAVMEIARDLVGKGAETILIACTDLSSTIGNDLPACIDSFEVLLNSTKKIIKADSQDLNKRLGD